MSALSAATVLPAIAGSPSIAQGSSPNGGYSRPDLAARFEDLYSRHRQQWEHDDRERDDYERQVFERTGVIFKGYGEGIDYPEGYAAARHEIGNSRHDDDPDLDAWGALSEECDELAELILNEPAATPADIILQARVCALANNCFWINEGSVQSMDFGGRAYRLLVERICEFGGTGALPGKRDIVPMEE